MIKISEEQANGLIAEELIKIGYEERVEEVYDELEKEAGKIRGAVDATGNFIKRNQPFQGAYYKRTGRLFGDAATGYTSKGRRAIKSGKSAIKKTKKSALKDAVTGADKRTVRGMARDDVKKLKQGQDRLSFGKRITRGLKATGKGVVPAAGTGALGYGGYRGVKAIRER